MAVVDNTNSENLDYVDYNMGNKIKRMMEKYVGNMLTEETSDLVMADLIAEFGDDIEAQVTVDDEINDIEVIIRDSNGVLMKCSSLKLFAEKLSV
jgi:hypothetical protein